MHLLNERASNNHWKTIEVLDSDNHCCLALLPLYLMSTKSSMQYLNHMNFIYCMNRFVFLPDIDLGSCLAVSITLCIYCPFISTMLLLDSKKCSYPAYCDQHLAAGKVLGHHHVTCSESGNTCCPRISKTRPPIFMGPR